MGTVLIQSSKRGSYPHNSQVILASTSSTRQKLLKKIRLSFKAVSHQCDEEKVKKENKGKSAQELSLILAEKKALSLALEYKECVIIASDQTLDCEGVLLNKPENIKEVEETLCFLKGKEHNLFTALVIWYQGEFIFKEISSSTLKMKNFNQKELENYLLNKGESVVGCLGAYHIEDKRYNWVEILDGEEEAIEGLPLQNLKKYIKE